MIHSQTVTPPLAAMLRHHVQIEDGDNKQQYQIKASQDALQVRLIVDQ